MPHVSKHKYDEQDNAPVLILGWSETLPLIMRELNSLPAIQQRALTLLSNELPASFKADYPKLSGLRVLRGDCRNAAELRSAGAASAGTILINTYGVPEGEQAALDILLAVRSIQPEKPFRRILILLYRDHLTTEILSAGGTETDIICIQAIIPRILAQVARQPKLIHLYRELLSFRENDIHFIPAGELTGKTFSKSLRLFENATVIGLAGNAQTRLNPPMNSVIGETDRIIIIGPDTASIRHSTPPLPAPRQEALSEERLSGKDGESYLILGWNRKTAATLNELSKYVSAGSTALVVSDRQPSPAPESLSTDNLRVSHTLAALYSQEFLDSLQLEMFENIIVFRNETDGDRRTMTLVNALRRRMGLYGLRNNLTIQLDSLDSVDSTDRSLHEHDIVSNDLVLHIAAQMTAHPDFGPVISEITNPHGAEIYLKPVENYLKLDTDVDFYTIIEAARRRNETAIGFVLYSDIHEQIPGHGIYLNPSRNHLQRFYHFDRIAVLSDEG